MDRGSVWRVCSGTECEDVKIQLFAGLACTRVSDGESFRSEACGIQGWRREHEPMHRATASRSVARGEGIGDG
jgi:hypothetical protein